MMKNILILLGLILSTAAFSQDYKKKIAKSSCDCVKSIKTEGKTNTAITSELGVCMLKAAMPFSKEIKKDYNIDPTADMMDSAKMEQLGIKMGILMAEECQEEFLKMAQFSDEEASVSESSELLINGTVSKIEKENFIIFHVIGENKMLNKLYWISSVDSNLDLPKEYQTLMNKKVNISYFTMEIFDPKINDYKTLNIISTLKTE
jgi:hypothetical protein